MHFSLFLYITSTTIRQTGLVKSELSICEIENPSSALRYGLLDIKPIPYEEVRKIKGRKFKVSGIRYEHEKQFSNIDEFITFRYNQIFERMPIPDKYSKEEVLNHFLKEAINYTKKDKELTEEFDKKEKSLLQFVAFIKKRYQEKINDIYETEASRFLKSNLPLTFFSETSMFANTYLKYLTLVEKIVRRHELLPRLPSVRRNIEKTEQHINTMKKELSPIIDKMDTLTIEILALKSYIMIWSAQDYNEIDEPAFIDKEKLDKTYFTEYEMVYSKELKETRKMLFAISKKYYPDLFTTQKTESNPENRMLGKLLLSCT
jgi:hypothetical protein